jgi:hypothetical protein
MFASPLLPFDSRSRKLVDPQKIPPLLTLSPGGGGFLPMANSERNNADQRHLLARSRPRPSTSERAKRQGNSGRYKVIQITAAHYYI